MLLLKKSSCARRRTTWTVRRCGPVIGRTHTNGKPQFVLGAGAAELVARVAVCLLLPAALAGGVVSAEAPQAAVYGLCVADPFAWMSADAVLCIPFFRNIMKEDYRYLYSGSGQGLVNGQ